VKKFSIYLSFLILPLVLFLSIGILKTANGPYYFFLFDHCYSYLAYSLDLSQSSATGFSPHPGVPVQVINAVVLKLGYRFSNTSLNFVLDVFTNPEKYLSMQHITFVILNSIALIILGIYSFRITNNLLLSLFIQLSAFGSIETLYGLLIVAPEQFLIFGTLCLIGIMLFYMYKLNPQLNAPFKFILIAAFVFGIGLATKLNYSPLMIIPIIIIPGLKNKLVFCLLTLLFFLILIFPLLIWHFDHYLGWMNGLLFSDYKSGDGDPSSAFLNNLYLVFTQNPYFSLSYTVTLFTILILFLKRSQLSNPAISKANKLLIGIFLAVSLQIFSVARHYSSYYMIPSEMLSNVCLIMCIYIWFDKKSTRFRNFAYAFLIVINLSYSFYVFNSFYKSLTWHKQEGIRAEDYIKTIETNKIVISAFNTSNGDALVVFATCYAGTKQQKYKKVLNKIFTNKIYYDPWHDKFYSLCDKNEMNEILKRNNKLILQFRGEIVLNNMVEHLEKKREYKNQRNKEIIW